MKFPIRSYKIMINGLCVLQTVARQILAATSKLATPEPSWC